MAASNYYDIVGSIRIVSLKISRAVAKIGGGTVVRLRLWQKFYLRDGETGHGERDPRAYALFGVRFASLWVELRDLGGRVAKS